MKPFYRTTNAGNGGIGCLSNALADLPGKTDGLERATQVMVVPPDVPNTNRR